MRSANASSNASVRGPIVSQPERSASAAASISAGAMRTSVSGMSNGVSIAVIEGIREAAARERVDDLGGAVGDRAPGHEAQLAAHLLERHPVVARVLVAVDVVDAAAPH